MADRKRSLKNIDISFMKRYNIDLVIKLYIILFNSIGKRTKKVKYIFVDEVKNANMNNNLHDTADKFIENNKDIVYLNFYKINGRENIKMGIKESFAFIFKYTLNLLKILLFSKNKKDKILYLAYDKFIKYLNVIDDENYVYILMTDHNFYSTIISRKASGSSVVMQHGLIQDKMFYYPIYADLFFCWGIVSRTLLNNDKKIIVTGTYKFDRLVDISERECSVNTLLFCISSLDTHIVQCKINDILSIIRSTDVKLIVKLHPGSFYKLSYWQDIYSNDNIKFLQDEPLNKIDCQIAISEDSTAIIDLLLMDKKVIFFDQLEGSYFERYKDILPSASTKHDLNKILSEIDEYDYTLIKKEIVSDELNELECSILDICEKKFES